MFVLAWLLLPDLPDYRTGLIIVGLARCIANGHHLERPRRGRPRGRRVLVALNSVFRSSPSRAGLVLPFGVARVARAAQTDLAVSGWAIARSVLIFLGIRAGRLPVPPRVNVLAPELVREQVSAQDRPFALYGLLSRSWCCSRCRAGRSPATR